MSDCRFGVSPVNYPDPDPDARDAQSDLSLRWAHRSFCWFCHAAAHIIIT